MPRRQKESTGCLLDAVRFSERPGPEAGYPFSLPLIQSIQSLPVGVPITFLVGENGSGKSTLLEAIAAAAGAITVGGEDIRTDPGLAPARALASCITLSWRRRTHRGFFMRAEDMLNFGVRTARTVHELEEQEAVFGRELHGHGRSLAMSTVRKERDALVRAYGEDLNARSHGESFLQVFAARFVPEGLFLLDEPDTALSPQRQLAFLAMLKDMTAQGGQFVIATHSPIVLAAQGANILVLDGAEVRPTPYDEVENVVLTRGFLANPEAYLRRL